MKISGPLSSSPSEIRSRLPVASGILPDVEGAHPAARNEFSSAGGCGIFLTRFRRAGSLGSTSGEIPDATFKRRNGVALVITLIMLSVITFLTIAFLVLSRRERAATTTVQSQTDVKLMNDTAVARVQAEMAARIMAQSNFLVNELIVSRNYIRPGGFTNQATTGPDTNNVHYDHKDTGAALTRDEILLNLANLYYDPRPPVFIRTNELGSNDFRFYLDLNRNGWFDTNGFLPVVIDEDGNTNTEVRNFAGDPEWIGLLERPEFAHSATNRFVGRYAYIVLPEGKMLDWNFIHNYAKGTEDMSPIMNPQTVGDGFLRNQGFGSWEINLAGFLYNLNTNYWGLGFQPTNIYTYRTNLNQPNLGPAFQDAVTILSNRYAGRYVRANLPSVIDTLGNVGWNIFAQDGIDAYPNGPIVPLTNYPPDDDGQFRNPPWAGSRNTNTYYHFAELFDPKKTSQLFTNRLLTMSVSSNSYDRYTFFRMLEQIGMNSTPDKTRMHLNYDNLVQSNAQSGIKSPTNFLQWRPIEFFTNAAERLVNRALVSTNLTNAAGQLYPEKSLDGYLVGTNFTFTNIQIHPTNHYTATPVLHRLLQLSANLYAATTNEAVGNRLTNAPYAFRPQFSRISAYNTTIVIISGYVDVSTNWQTQIQRPFLDLNDPGDRAQIPVFPAKSDANVLGIPWVVSAKKGFPNFNEFTLETRVKLTRKLQFRKSGSTITTNELLLLGVTNYFGVETWNSYTQAYNAPVRIFATNITQMALSNHNVAGLMATGFPTENTNGSVTTSNFMGGRFYSPAGQPLGTPFVTNTTNFVFLPNSKFLGGGFTIVTNYSSTPNNTFNLPKWVLLTTNYFIYALVDTNANRLLDFVNLAIHPAPMDLTNLLYDPNLGAGNNTYAQSAMWNPEIVHNGSGMSMGVWNQIMTCKGTIGHPNPDWTSENSGSTFAGTPSQQQAAFTNFLYSRPAAPTNVEAPWNPTMYITRRLSFQANDPLVHYLTTDLAPGNLTVTHDGKNVVIKDPNDTGNISQSMPNLGAENLKYRPWGVGENGFELYLKDPLVRSSDDWEFPTNKFPSIGWMGRVHRGTPWQTMYLKSAPSLPPETLNKMWTNDWASIFVRPESDWKLLDLFTAAPNENAMRGLLSVNQTNLAAWSAVLSGVSVLSNSHPTIWGQFPYPGLLPRFDETNIEPFMIRDDNPIRNRTAIEVIVEGINNYKASPAFLTNNPSGLFQTLGDIVGVPEFTLNSPFLQLTNIDYPGLLDTNQAWHVIPDSVYERIPQQILGLLKAGESRIVVYSYGQSLKPAEDSILLDPPSNLNWLKNICTNYQITGEMATRTVLRFDGTPDKPKVVIESFNVMSEE